MPQGLEVSIGFADGHVLSYRAESDKLQLEYNFWNDQQRTLIFEGFVGLRDHCAIGVEVSEVVTKDASEYIDFLTRRLYVEAPADFRLRHFQFLDLDGEPMLDIAAASCTSQ